MKVMKQRRFWKFGVENTGTYFSIHCGLFTLYFCRCGECFLPLILTHREPKPLTRTCGFCFCKFTYDEMPDDSICYLGIFACADCLESDITSEFREIVEAQKTEAAG
jgi:hypothetical protein